MQTFTVLLVLFLIIQILFSIYIILPFISLVIYGIIKQLSILTPYERRKVVTAKNFEFGIIITAHQETRFVIPLVDSLVKQTYPGFLVYVVADDCDINDLKFEDERIIVLKPETSLNAKVKSIQYAIEHFRKKHDAIIIFDADNLVHPSFMEVMNQHFKKGYRVVQADFKPKNTDTNYARMDAIGDMFNFFLEREIRMRLGLSATIWGSGVAFDYSLYENIQYKDLLGGFDKKLQSHLVQQVKTIGFAPEAILFDEKITSGKSLETQRTRWISAYFKYFGDSFKIFLRGVREFNFNLIYFGFNLLRPPLFITLALGILFMVIDYFINPILSFIWFGILGSFVISFIAIVIIKSRDTRFLKTLLFIPLFMFRQFGALMKLNKAKKSFLKTQHTELIYIDDLLGDKRKISIHKSNSPGKAML